jgi:hypothetical protein
MSKCIAGLQKFTFDCGGREVHIPFDMMNLADRRFGNDLIVPYRSGHDFLQGANVFAMQNRNHFRWLDTSCKQSLQQTKDVNYPDAFQGIRYEGVSPVPEAVMAHRPDNKYSVTSGNRSPGE